MGKTKGIILALISSGTFGLIAFFSKPLFAEGLHPLSILFYRSLFASTVLGIICLCRKKSFKLSKKIISQLIFLGILYTITSFGLVYSYKYISSGIATTIHFLYPIVVAGLMIIFFKEKLTGGLIIAALLSIVGVAFLCWSDSQFVDYRGLLSVGITVFTYAIYIVSFSGSELKKLDSEVILFYIVTAGTVIFFIYITCSIGFQTIPNLYSFCNLFLFATITTVLSSMALVKAVQITGSTITSVLGSMEPLVATVVGIFYFDEDFGWNSFVGLILIIVAVTIVVLQSSKKQKAEIE